MRARLGPSFHRFWASAAMANLGDGVRIVAWPWAATLLTRDPLAIAAVAIALRLPWLVFSLPAGVITDRIDRRRLIWTMDLARAAAIGALAIALIAAPDAPPDALPPLYWALLAGGLVVGAAEVLRDNAAQTFLPALVDKDRLEAANGRLFSVEVLTNQMIGPPLAGFLIAFSLSFAFGTTGAGFLCAGLLVLSIRPQPTAKTCAPRRSWIAEAKEGFVFLWRNPLLRNLALGLGALNAIYELQLVTIVLLAQESLGLSSAEYGLLLTGAAAGGVVGGLLAAPLVARLGPGTALRIMLVVTVIEMLAIGLTNSPIIVWFALAIGSCFAVIWNTVTVSLRQRAIPSALLGRVNSVYRFFGWGMMPLGMLAAGLIMRAGEAELGRDAALRLPYFVGAALGVLLAVAMWRTAANERLKDARFT